MRTPEGMGISNLSKALHPRTGKRGWRTGFSSCFEFDLVVRLTTDVHVMS